MYSRFVVRVVVSDEPVAGYKTLVCGHIREWLSYLASHWFDCNL